MACWRLVGKTPCSSEALHRLQMIGSNTSCNFLTSHVLMACRHRIMQTWFRRCSGQETCDLITDDRWKVTEGGGWTNLTSMSGDGAAAVAVRMSSTLRPKMSRSPVQCEVMRLEQPAVPTVGWLLTTQLWSHVRILPQRMSRTQHIWFGRTRADYSAVDATRCSLLTSK